VKVTLESKGAKIAWPALALLGVLLGLPLLILGSREAASRLASPIAKLKRLIFGEAQTAESLDEETMTASGSHRKY
jgi:hypothetical protein